MMTLELLRFFEYVAQRGDHLAVRRRLDTMKMMDGIKQVLIMCIMVAVLSVEDG